MERTIRKNTRFEILTPSGWSDFDGISQTLSNKLIDVDGLLCTPDHRLKINDELVEAKWLGQEITYDTPVFVYDPLDVKSDNLYYSNDKISHNCEFQGSSGTLISGSALKNLVAQIPIYHKENLAKYKDPVKNHNYCIIADVSEGKGLDYSAFSVIDITQMPYDQVCTYRSNLATPGDFAEIMFRTAKAYNDPMILIEMASLGGEVFNALVDLEYENLLYTVTAGVNGKKIWDGGSGSSKPERGVKTGPQVKAQGCSMIKLLVEQEQLIINDFHTIEEISRFVKKNKSYSAEEGWHDDTVMCLVLFGWLSKQDYFKSITDTNVIQNLRDKAADQIEEDMVPFGFVDAPPPAGQNSFELATEVWTTNRNPLAIPLYSSPGYVNIADDDAETLNDF